MHKFIFEAEFHLEQGQSLSKLSVAYHTYGTLNKEKNNVIWICHALTANSDAAAWWPGMVGEGCCFDTSKYFVVCANILGSCYGTTGPLSIDPETSSPYYHQFPAITIRDMVQAHQLLCRHLEITRIQLLVGGSMGGYQAVEWCAMEPTLISNLFLIATSSKETPWGKAIHATQRMAIETDSTWTENSDDAGKNGLKTARAIGMITYRSFQTFSATQNDEVHDLQTNYKAASYVQYQGDKLAKRFNAYSYWYLTYAMDSHNLARGRAVTVAEVLQGFRQNTLIIGISSDIISPVQEQIFLKENIPQSQLVIIDSLYGHDGFLIETDQITAHVKAWWAHVSVD
jgi:homoserine O-acetyltransferase